MVQATRDESARINAIALRIIDDTPQSPMDEGYKCIFMDTDGVVKSVDHAGTVAQLLAAGDALVSSLTEKDAGAGIEVASQLWSPRGAAVPETAISFGGDKTEGLHIKVLEEVVDLTALGAKYKALTTGIPTNAVLLSVQANIEELVVASGTTVKVGLGYHAGSVSALGITGSLVKNQKITSMLDWAVGVGTNQIDVCGVVTDGSALGSGNITAGKVRVVIVYIIPVDLADA